MVSISHELPVVTERRLLDVIRAANVEHLPGTWSFVGFHGPIPDQALAAVKGRNGWSALVPASDGSSEVFSLTRTFFSSEIENSGFVGWLASTIKRHLGSGLFLVCGDDPTRGGIFDYLGYPTELTTPIRELIDRLRGASPADEGPLELRILRVVETSAASAISTDTVFQFRQRGATVEATYSGGRVERGYLVAQHVRDQLVGGYVQLHTDGEIRTGKNTMRIESRPSGGLQLTEQCVWSDGTVGRNLLRSVDGVDD